MISLSSFIQFRQIVYWVKFVVRKLVRQLYLSLSILWDKITFSLQHFNRFFSLIRLKIRIYHIWIQWTLIFNFKRTSIWLAVSESACTTISICQSSFLDFSTFILFPNFIDINYIFAAVINMKLGFDIRVYFKPCQQL